MLPLFLQDALHALRAARPRVTGLSGRLLAYTVVVVLAAEILILAPTLAAFRTQWLKERVEAAQLASLALEAAPDAMVAPSLAEELLANAEVTAVFLQRDGRRQLILRPRTEVMASVRVDLRGQGMFGSMADTLGAMFADPDAFIRITAAPRLEGGEEIVVIAPSAPLKRELLAYGRRVLINSVVLSAATGALVYLALLLTLVRPMMRMAAAMVRFRAAPEDASRIITPSGRGDEIGQAERELEALQRDVRQALHQRERLAALGAAVAKINHDLRNVLTSAQLMSDRLAANADPKIRGQGERLVRAVGRGVRLAEDVLRYGRAEEPVPAPQRVELRGLVEDAFADAVAAVEVATGLDVQVGWDVYVEVDPEHAHRIFLNLMRNAAQILALHRPGRGVITVWAETHGADIVTAVADNGPGVPERARDGLFQAFAASTMKGGSGLGLSIARELARVNGGDVTLAASSADGATFAVRLPAAAAATP